MESSTCSGTRACTVPRASSPSLAPTRGKFGAWDPSNISPSRAGWVGMGVVVVQQAGRQLRLQAEQPCVPCGPWHDGRQRPAPQVGPGAAGPEARRCRSCVCLC